MSEGSVEADIRFLGPCTRKPVFHDRRSENDYLPLETHRVRIARAARTDFELDREGFALLRHVSAVTDLAQARSLYLREIEALIAATTGATKVVALGNGVVRRSERAASRAGATVLGRFAHADFSTQPAGSEYWVEKMLPPGEARARLSKRFAIYNVWRALSPPPQDAPLALCDVRSVAAGDVVGCDQVLERDDGEERFELSLYRFSPAQRWVYFPDLGRDDVLVFKGYDSDPTRVQAPPHAAFDDPTCPPGAPARESIDERVIAFFD